MGLTTSTALSETQFAVAAVVVLLLLTKKKGKTEKCRLKRRYKNEKCVAKFNQKSKTGRKVSLAKNLDI